MKNILIEANRISKIYDPDVLLKRGKNEYALRGVDFVLEEGDFISVMGPSGSGKSTLVNCLSTLDKISKGHLKIFGEDTLSIKDDVLAEFRNKYLGFIFQNHNLIASLTFFDNIAVPLLLNGVENKEISEKVNRLAEMLGIKKLLDKKPSQCSGGECQRAAIARALIHDPRIIICDEPTGNLDSRNSHEILRILSDLNKQGVTIVLVTHDPLIASYSQKLMYLYDGRIIETMNRNEDSQLDYYHRILKVTSKDSDVEKILSNDEYVELNEKMFEQRTDVYMMLDYKKYDEKIETQYRPLLIHDDCMVYKTRYNEKVKIPLVMIRKVVLDVEGKRLNFGVFGDDVYHVCFDFIGDQMSFQFKSMNQEDMLEVIEFFRQKGFEIECDERIIEAYQKYHDRMERNKYLKREFKDKMLK